MARQQSAGDGMCQHSGRHPDCLFMSATAASGLRALHVERQNSTSRTPSARPNGGRRAPLTRLRLLQPRLWICPVLPRSREPRARPAWAESYLLYHELDLS